MWDPLRFDHGQSAGGYWCVESDTSGTSGLVKGIRQHSSHNAPCKTTGVRRFPCISGLVEELRTFRNSWNASGSGLRPQAWRVSPIESHRDQYYDPPCLLSTCDVDLPLVRHSWERWPYKTLTANPQHTKGLTSSISLINLEYIHNYIQH